MPQTALQGPSIKQRRSQHAQRHQPEVPPLSASGRHSHRKQASSSPRPLAAPVPPPSLQHIPPIFFPRNKETISWTNSLCLELHELKEACTYSKVMALPSEGKHGVELSFILIRCEINSLHSKSPICQVAFLTCDGIYN